MKNRPKKAPYTRVRGELITPPSIVGATEVHWDWVGSSPTVSTTPRYVSPGIQIGRQCVDVCTPAYKEIVASGGIVNNPFTVSVGDFGFLPFSGVTYDAVRKTGLVPGAGSRNRIVYRNYVPDPTDPRFPTIISPDVEVLRANAINTAFANSHQRDVMGQVDLAEFGKTADMLHTNLGRIEKLLRGTPLTKDLKRIKKSKVLLKSYQPRSASAHAANIANLHLEIQYGFIPLILSIEGLVHAVTSAAQPERNTFRGFDRQQEQIRRSNVVFEAGVGGLLPFPMQRKVTFELELQYRSNVRAGVMTDYHPTLRERLGTTWRDLPSAGYELIPFSFVADWFLDMGTAIEAAVPVPGYKNLASWCTTLVEETRTYRQITESAFQSNADWGLSHPAWQAEMYVTTSVKTRVPGVTPRAPKLDLRFKSTTHALSALALAFTLGRKQLLSRHKL